MLDSDLLTIMQATANGTLAQTEVKWKNGNACCVVLASKGYPEAYEKGKVINMGKADEMANVYHSGTAFNAQGELVTAGGRVLGISCVRDNLSEAVKASYMAASQVRFEKLHMRTDIGRRALACQNTTEE